MRPRFLYLYTELADYFLACLKALVEEHQAEIHLVRWPINQEAPFQFTIPAGVVLYEKAAYSRAELIKIAQELKPNLIFCSGWMDKDYLAVVRSFHKRIPALVGLDNHWTGALKQQLACLLSPFTLHRLFTHAFVAGAPQALYARKLSFAPSHILQGYYAANVPVFYQQYLDNLAAKSAAYPKRFLYVGRYVPHKGLDVLWQAFTELQAEQPNDWELWCLGTGPLEKEAVKHPKIKHFGFVQPAQLVDFISQAGVFVLPSLFEPWGVVVHEFAAAGFPLICTDKVGAATAFLEDGHNGYIVKAGDINALKDALGRIIKMTDPELLEMGKKSTALALKNNPSVWASKLIELVQVRANR
ncbi:glycosyltransferase family 4 protein [Pontibacter vulgaris]|uniref:glycosyltransferase family 4 protein n=1 Tax=Pontibacter vulgaris TaxID=2905679 RepID=UPI001FA6C3F6|nr:glycosyltransferase family 4 protein [Pontibacter vulgaris]